MCRKSPLSVPNLQCNRGELALREKLFGPGHQDVLELGDIIASLREPDAA